MVETAGRRSVLSANFLPPIKIKNNYEARHEARRQRYLARAEKAKQKSQDLSEKSSSMLSAIPFGQPILVGHHSEKGDRSYRNRACSLMDKSVEADEKAKYYEAKVEAIDNNHAISSDDPEALTKLKDKLRKLENSQQYMKEQNAKARAEKSGKPFMAYQLSNNNANIRTTKERIKHLEKAADMQARLDIHGNGWTLHEDKDQNRIQFIFAGKPDEATRRELKSYGFRWSPMNMAWQRMLNSAGRYAADRIISQHLK
jgi:hypothetical protein